MSRHIRGMNVDAHVRGECASKTKRINLRENVRAGGREDEMSKRGVGAGRASKQKRIASRHDQYSGSSLTLTPVLEPGTIGRSRTLEWWCAYRSCSGSVGEFECDELRISSCDRF